MKVTRRSTTVGLLALAMVLPTGALLGADSGHVSKPAQPETTQLAAADCGANPDLRELEMRTFARTNEVRRREGLRDLDWNGTLAAMAREHSCRMATIGFFDHTDPERGNLRARLLRADLGVTVGGENLHMERGYPDPARSAIEGWLQSREHRQILMDPTLTQSGLGIVLGRDGTYFFTQNFTDNFKKGVGSRQSGVGSRKN